MSEIRHEFAVDEGLIVDITVLSGDIVVSESATADLLTVRIEGSGAEDFKVEQRGNVVAIAPEKGRGVIRRFFSADVIVEAPAQADVQLHAGSGDIIVNGPIGDCNVALGSGDVKLRDVGGDATVKTASGDIHIQRVGGRLRVSTASGDVRVGSVAADCSLNSASGDIFCDVAGGPVDIKTASGDATLGRVEGDAVTAKTLSGTLRLGVPPSRLITFDLQSLSGELRNNLAKRNSDEAASYELDIRVKTVSGDVYLNNA